MSREIKDPGLSIKCVDKGCVDIKYVRCTLSPNSAINKFRPFDTLSSTAPSHISQLEDAALNNYLPLTQVLMMIYPTLPPISNCNKKQKL